MARDKHSGELVALKKLRMERERDGELPAAVARTLQFVWVGWRGWLWNSCVERTGAMVSCLLRVPLHT